MSRGFGSLILFLVATIQLRLLEIGERVFRLALLVLIPGQTVSIRESRAHFGSLPKPGAPSALAAH